MLLMCPSLPISGFRDMYRCAERDHVNVIGNVTVCVCPLFARIYFMWRF